MYMHIYNAYNDGIQGTLAWEMSFNCLLEYKSITTIVTVFQKNSSYMYNNYKNWQNIRFFDKYLLFCVDI